MSTTITDEQRRRMDENRKKAMEKRATAALATAKTADVQKSISSLSNPNAPPRNSNTNFTAGPNHNVASLSANQNSYNQPRFSFKPHQSQPQQRGGVKPITGSCLLVSRDRFLVDLPFHPQANALFKTIQGYNYDVMKKKWTFPIAEHAKLIAAIASLKPDVCLGPLPSYILRIFRNVNPKTTIGADVDLSRIDPVLLRALMPFQREGVRFGISREGRVLIADDMGLGKTIQALGIAHYYYSEWPLLIATPSSMRFAWRESIWNWLPSICAGSIAVIESSRDPLLSAKVLIMSYDILQKRSDELEHCKVIIMDESHHLKNSKTARSRAAVPLLQNAKRAILLSGTPALSRPIELFTQIIAINRHTFPSISDYGTRYCDGRKNAWGWDFTGSSNMQELQLLLEETVMLRRLKSDVLTQLPAKQREVLILDPLLVKLKSKDLQTKATAFKEGKNLKAMEKRGRLLEYFSETGKAKVNAVVAYVKDLVESGSKFLCFAHHRYVLDGICEALESVKCQYIRIDGNTPSEARKELCDKFQFTDSILVAVLSIQAANAGITLTAAHVVVFAELFWNPGILTQAEDRAHRIGQEDSVLVKYLLAKGTADDVIWPMVQDKLDVLNKAGLSKDNFRDADANALVQKPTLMYHSVSDPTQPEIKHFFKPTSSLTPSPTSTDVVLNEDLACLFEDDPFNDDSSILFDDSFDASDSDVCDALASIVSRNHSESVLTSESTTTVSGPSKKSKF